MAALADYTCTEVPDELLPEPLGWQVLLQIPDKVEKSQGGIILAEETQRAQEAYGSVAKVVAMGNLCYQGKERGNGVPWVSVGDWIIHVQNQGQIISVKIPNTDIVANFRIISDTQIKAKVPNPNVIEGHV